MAQSGSKYPNSGALFMNDRKTTDRHPDWTGTAEVDGKKYRVSMWEKDTRDGKPMRSLSFRPDSPGPGVSESGRGDVPF